MRYGKIVTEIEEEAYDWLDSYSWPGNFQELREVIQRGVLVCSGRALTRDDLFLRSAYSAEPSSGDDEVDEVRAELLDARQQLASSRARLDELQRELAELKEQDEIKRQELEKLRASHSDEDPQLLNVFELSYEEVELKLLKRALEKADGNKSEAARILGLKRSTFVHKLKKFPQLDS